jgi:Predicted permeases
MEILSITVPIFIFLVAGYLMGRKNIITGETKTFLSRFVYYFAFPAMTFRSIVSFDFAGTFRLKLVIANLSVTTIVFVFTFILAFAIRNRFKRGAFNMACFRSNQGYMGLPVVTGFYGTEAMSRAAVINGFDSPLVIILSVFALEIFKGSKKRDDSRRIAAVIGEKMLSFISNPFIISSFLGLILSYYKVPVLKISILDKFLETASSMALPLSLISVGCSIEVRNLKKDLKLVLGASSIKLLVMPVLALVLGYYFFDLRGADLGMIVILAATSTSVSSYVMSCEMGTDGELNAAIIGFTTLLSALTVTIIQFVLVHFII